MKTYKVTTRVEGMKEPFVDWFEAESVQGARMAWARECQACGVPLANSVPEIVECDPRSLKPIS